MRSLVLNVLALLAAVTLSAQPLTLNDPVMLQSFSSSSGPTFPAAAAYWKFDSTSGTTFTDATGNGFTLTASSGATTISGAGGVINNFGSLLGGAGSATNADNSTLGIGSGKSFTISVWEKPGGSPAANTFICGKWIGNDSTKQDYLIETLPGTTYLGLRVFNLAGTEVDVTNNIYNAQNGATGDETTGASTFVHIAAGYDDANQYIWIQVNNGPRMIAPCVGVRRTSAPFWVFNDPPATSGVTLGQDEIGFWTSTLTPQNVADIYNVRTGLAYPFTVTTPGTASPIATTNIEDYVAALAQSEANRSGRGMITNGTMRAIVKLWNGIIADGLLSKMKAVNVFPMTDAGSGDDNSGCYPIYQPGLAIKYGPGNAGSWGPFGGFSPVPRSITLNGVAWDGNGGLTEFYDTKVNESTAFAAQTSTGVSCYVYTNHQNGGYEMGVQGASPFNGIIFAANPDGHTYGKEGSGSSNLITINSPGNPPPLGFYSDNRISSTDHRLYFANSGTAFAQIGTTDTTAWNSTLPSLDIFVMGINNNGTSFGADDPSIRISYVSIHDGFSSAEAQKEYNRVQQYLIDKGGGYR